MLESCNTAILACNGWAGNTHWSYSIRGRITYISRSLSYTLYCQWNTIPCCYSAEWKHNSYGDLTPITAILGSSQIEWSTRYVCWCNRSPPALVLQVNLITHTGISSTKIRCNTSPNPSFSISRNKISINGREICFYHRHCRGTPLRDEHPEELTQRGPVKPDTGNQPALSCQRVPKPPLATRPADNNR